MKGTASPRAHSVIAVTWPFVTVMLLLLLIAMTSVTALSAFRAYVSSFYGWSAAERDVAALTRGYATEPTSQHLAQLERALEVLRGDRAAREELLGPRPNLQRARNFLLAANNQPEDIDSILRFFRIVRLEPRWQKPLESWFQAQALSAQYDQLVEDTQRRVEQGPASDAELGRWRAENARIHDEVSSLVRNYAPTMDAAARALAHALEAFLAASGILLLCGSYFLTRSILRRTAAMAEALRASERLAYEEHERATVLLRSIGDAVISTDRHGKIMFLNQAAERLTGWSLVEARGHPLERVFKISPSDDHSMPPLHDAIKRLLRSGELTRLTHSSPELVRRDGSRVPISERAAPLKDPEGGLIGIVVVMRDVTTERHLSDQLHHQAMHDVLTGLPNRAQFEQRLATTLEAHRLHETPYAAMFLDLDQFKVVNDTSGHNAGDALIRRIGATIHSQLREGDLLARLGGDEFGLILSACSIEVALQVAERIRHAVEAVRFLHDGRTFTVGVSIGLVYNDPSLHSVDDVLSAADRACYAAKAAGRNRVRIYRADDREIDSRRSEMQWIARLSEALELDRFVLFVQEIRPIGPPSSARRSYYEVLLRLRDDQGQLIPPMTFIPAAERFGLMPQIDRWVITHTCAEQQRRRQLGLDTPTVMVNLSSASIDNPDLATFIDRCQKEHQLPPGLLGFELTETAAISNLAAAVNVMKRLKELGAPVALDDFGSGMSSYTYLRELPVDILKIDGSFVRDISRDPIAHAMVDAMHSIARAIGIRTVAEWVEDSATLSLLEAMQVDYAQGYVVGREVQWNSQHGAGERHLREAS